MRNRVAAFSLVELLVTAAIAAAVITAGVMLYQSFVAAGGTRSSYGTVTLAADVLPNFYGSTGETTIDTFFAPNFGRAAQAELLRDRFVADIREAAAVFCLGREGRSSIRPTEIPLTSPVQGARVDTPEAFRQLLAAEVPASATVFTTYRGASNATNASLFVLEPAQDSTSLAVRSIYEIDLVPAVSPDGTYASVRRYEGANLTDYYDIFYPASQGVHAFNPLVVAFERSVRRTVVEGETIDRLKVAEQRPFYFVWWPDPAVSALEAFDAPAYSATDPRAAFASMGGRTALFLVVPMFPAL